MITLYKRLPRHITAALCWLPAFTLYGVITWLSNQPQLPGPGTAVGDWLWFKSAHFIVYSLLTFLVWIGWRSLSFSFSRAHLATWYTLILAASIDEWHQSFVVGRGSRISDVLIDLLAAWAVLQSLSRYNHEE